VTKVDTPAAVVVPKVDTPAVVVVVDPGLPKDVLISGKVLDEKTKLPIGTSLSFLTTSGKLLGEIASNPSTGEYSLRLPASEGYTIKADKQYYFPVNDFVNTSQPDSKGEVRHDITMTPLPMQVGQTFVLKDIYFDLDKSILKPESRAELQRLYQLINDNPGLEIEIRGHTDNWSSDEYNETLSNNRANAVVNYLKFMGVRGSRMTWKGFGEKQPIATNETDEGRALNRRVEFVVTKI
jgi:OOP family OmpA-OmpF porin